MFLKYVGCGVKDKVLKRRQRSVWVYQLAVAK